MCAGVGCRIGEALALDVPDYDPRTGLLSITKTYTVKYGLGIGLPKSENGVRTIRVTLHVRPAVLAAIGQRTSGPLFATGSGTRCFPVDVAVGLKCVRRELGLPYRSCHVLRHSVAAHLVVAAGVSVAGVAKYLGDSIETITPTYINPSESTPRCRSMRNTVGIRWARMAATKRPCEQATTMKQFTTQCK
mgnify:CR=1 FL=1